MTHDEIAELIGAYALDAVDSEEAAEVARHVAECPRCAEELAAHHSVAAVLANTGEDAPPELWGRIAAHIEPRNEELVRAVPSIARTRAARAAESGGAARGDAPARGSGGRGRRLARRRVRAIVAATAAAAAVVIAVLGFQVARLDHRVGQLSAASGHQGLSQAIQSALVDPQARRVVLASTTPGSQPEVEMMMLPSGAAYVVDSKLPPLPANRTYQLWAVTDGRAVSLGVLGSHVGTVALQVGTPAPKATYAVTVELAGGAATPSYPPVAESS